MAPFTVSTATRPPGLAAATTTWSKRPRKSEESQIARRIRMATLSGGQNSPVNLIIYQRRQRGKRNCMAGLNWPKDKAKWLPVLSLEAYSKGLGHRLHIFVAAAAQVDDHDLVFGEGGGQLDGVVDGMGRLQGGNDALLAAK